MFGGLQMKLIMVGLLAAAIAAGAWRYHHVKSERDEYKAEAAQTKADLTALRTAYAHERKIATEASNDYESRLQALSAAAVATPVRSVRLCRSPTGYVPAPGPTSSGTGSADPSGQPGEAGRDSEAGPDVGVELYALADAADKAAAQCNALIHWVNLR
jgi:hypothetical protein